MTQGAQHSNGSDWPPLPLGSWQETFETLHMWTQLVGKTRLALAPMENHWWQCTLYVSARGLSTGPMPSGPRVLSVDFDFVDHQLTMSTSDGDSRRLPLVAESVARFHARYMQALRELGFEPRILGRPVEVQEAIPFAEDEKHGSYDRDAVQRWWRALVQVDRVFKRFRGGFLGKQSPAHFWWGSFDHAVTRFSGRTAPRHPGGAPNCADYVMVEAYSHECSSAGFWPGGGPTDEAAFYAYVYPEPEGYGASPVEPAAAWYHSEAREFILPYEAVRSAPDPDSVLLQFLESTYQAAAVCGRWDRAALERKVVSA